MHLLSLVWYRPLVLSTWETGVEGFQVEGFSDLQNKFKASLDSVVRFHLKIEGERKLRV